MGQQRAKAYIRKGANPAGEGLSLGGRRGPQKCIPVKRAVATDLERARMQLEDLRAQALR